MTSPSRAKMDPYMGVGPPPDLRVFTVGFGLVQLVGLTCVVLVAVWTNHFLGGFAGPSNPKLEFNYHPLFMVLGLIFCYGNGILVYRVLRHERKTRLKLLHAGLQGLSFIFAVVALKTVFDSHDLVPSPIPNLYSLHSWLGLTAVILFSMQFFVGFVTFLFPGLGQLLRAKYLPLHVFFGLAIFVMAVAAALMGITEKLIFKLTPGGYSAMPNEAYLANFLGLLLVIFASLVVYLATQTAYRRQPLPEEAALPLEPQTPADCQWLPHSQECQQCVHLPRGRSQCHRYPPFRNQTLKEGKSKQIASSPDDIGHDVQHIC
ncbi:transmembrane ascorbate-dependent reductase CYB561-like isoform X3 [Ornithodoros turicata]|uniref:transmembrane ascorbate-dependent reductase CYB561-like isoform X3 n=1 Tax=Ornithodoros turicata TaxID=34597 RepID=UPI0031388824